jgi:membrane protein DedA with SNARE-associated domain
VQRVSKYLLISGVSLAVVAGACMFLGFLTIDVPAPTTWLFIYGAPALIVAIVLIAIGGVLWAIKRGRSKAL